MLSSGAAAEHVVRISTAESLESRPATGTAPVPTWKVREP